MPLIQVSGDKCPVDFSFKLTSSFVDEEVSTYVMSYIHHSHVVEPSLQELRNVQLFRHLDSILESVTKFFCIPAYQPWNQGY